MKENKHNLFLTNIKQHMEELKNKTMDKLNYPRTTPVKKGDNIKIEMDSKLKDEFSEKFYYQSNRTKFHISFFVSYLFNLFSLTTGAISLYFIMETTMNFGLYLPIVLEKGVAVIPATFSIFIMALVEIFKRNGINDIYKNGWLLGEKKIKYPTIVFNVALAVFSIYMSYDGVTRTVNYTYTQKDTIEKTLISRSNKIESATNILLDTLRTELKALNNSIKNDESIIFSLTEQKSLANKRKNTASKMNDWAAYNIENSNLQNIEEAIKLKTDSKQRSESRFKVVEAEIKKKENKLEEKLKKEEKVNKHQKNLFEADKGKNMVYMIIISLISEILLILTVMYCIFYKYTMYSEITKHNEAVTEQNYIKDLENHLTMKNKEILDLKNDILENSNAFLEKEKIMKEKITVLEEELKNTNVKPKTPRKPRVVNTKQTQKNTPTPPKKKAKITTDKNKFAKAVEIDKLGLELENENIENLFANIKPRNRVKDIIF